MNAHKTVPSSAEAEVYPFPPEAALLPFTPAAAYFASSGASSFSHSSIRALFTPRPLLPKRDRDSTESADVPSPRSTALTEI